MKKITKILIVILVFFGLTLIVESLTRDKFEYAVKHYDGKNVRQPIDGGEEFIDSVVIECFSPQKDGNVVVLFTQNGVQKIENWNSIILTAVIIRGKANNERYGGSCSGPGGL